MIAIKINVTRIDKKRFFKGTKGTYLDCILVEKPTEFDDGFIAQSIDKESRDRGEKGPVIGSWRQLDKKPAPKPKEPAWEPEIKKPPAPNPQRDLLPEDDDIPF